MPVITSESAQQLESLGWNSHWEQAFRAHALALGHTPGRVVRQERAWLWVDQGTQQLRVGLSGRLRHEATCPADLPIIGDWVLLSEGPVDGSELVAGLLPRASLLLRRRPGGALQSQPLAANVDVALVVVGLDRELSLGLIERAVVMARTGGIEPAIVLTKADLCMDLPERLQLVGERLPELRVLPVSAHSGQGMERLREMIGPRQTATMMGPSGVGKSTLTNYLLGSEGMQTGSVRVGDGKGKHTTTHRQLFQLPGGGALIDGPGVRELGIWGTAESLEESFPEVTASALRCRRRACQHGGESGCAVQIDVSKGLLSAERVKHYRRLLEEHSRPHENRGRPTLRKGGGRGRRRSEED